MYVVPAFEVNEWKVGPNVMRELADSSVRVDKPAFLKLVHDEVLLPFHKLHYIPGQLATGGRCAATLCIMLLAGITSLRILDIKCKALWNVNCSVLTVQTTTSGSRQPRPTPSFQTKGESMQFCGES